MGVVLVLPLMILTGLRERPLFLIVAVLLKLLLVVEAMVVINLRLPIEALLELVSQRTVLEEELEVTEMRTEMRPVMAQAVAEVLMRLLLNSALEAVAVQVVMVLMEQLQLLVMEERVLQMPLSVIYWL